VGHTDAITSLLLTQKSNQNMLVSGGHDGAVRGWDIRTFQCIYDIAAHRKKYDEGVLSIAACDKFPLIASGKIVLRLMLYRWS
jgi:striatin 1/3/4